MLWIVILSLVVLWTIATVTKVVAGGLIHILLLVAVALLIYRFAFGERPL